jgi:hypothetical protein
MFSKLLKRRRKFHPIPINWMAYEPLSKMKLIKEETTKTKKDVLETKINATKVAIFTIKYEPIITETIKGPRTLYNVLKTHRKATHRRMKPTPELEKKLKRLFIHWSDSLESYKKELELYKKGKLRPIDLFGNHVYFEGYQYLNNNIVDLFFGS